MKLMLVKLDAEPLLAENGKIGLDFLAQHNDIKLIFCDVEMPVMNGLTMIKEIDTKVKKNELQRVPIVMMTALGHKQIIIKAKTYGIVGYLLKPVSREVVQKLYNKFVLEADGTDMPEEEAVGS